MEVNMSYRMVFSQNISVVASFLSFIAIVSAQVDGLMIQNQRMGSVMPMRLTPATQVTLLTCNDDKSIDLAISNADGQYVSILGCAEEQTVSAGTATLSTCSLQWGTWYTVQVYTNQGIFTNSDYSEGIKCVRSTDDITVTIQPTISNPATDATVTGKVMPSITMSLTSDSAGTTPVTTVTVGTMLYLNLDMGSDFITSDGFDIRAKTITVTSGSTTVTLTGDSADGDGCQSQIYWGAVVDMGQGSLQVQFNAFMIATGTSALDTQIFTVTLEVCLGTACANYTCGGGLRKKRAVDETIIDSVQSQRQLVVVGIPFETGNDNNENTVENQASDDVCVNKISLYSVSTLFIVGLVLSVMATLFMFFKTRTTRRANKP